MANIGTRSGAGELQYCLVKGGQICLDRDGSARISPWLKPILDLEDGKGGVWFPIENADSQPFNPQAHYREKPHYVFAGDRVLRMYPVRSKTADEIQYEKQFERAS